jgi:hypothetical protein
MVATESYPTSPEPISIMQVAEAVEATLLEVVVALMVWVD